MTVRRTRWEDWYVADEPGDGSAVLAGGNVVVLSELATALVAAVPPGGAEVDQLTGALVAAFGAPVDGDATDAATATATAVDDLVASGVLEQHP